MSIRRRVPYRPYSWQHQGRGRLAAMAAILAVLAGGVSLTLASLGSDEPEGDEARAAQAPASNAGLKDKATVVSRPTTQLLPAEPWASRMDPSVEPPQKAEPKPKPKPKAKPKAKVRQPAPKPVVVKASTPTPRPVYTPSSSPAPKPAPAPKPKPKPKVVLLPPPPPTP